MRVLSLFDGISCGQESLRRLGIPVTEYYACEIDKYAIQVANANFPKTVQMGDINTLDFRLLPKIDLLLVGSPCQGLSFMGKRK